MKFFCSGCDGCEEWYHGDCINITEKEAKHIKHYYCQKCKEDDPSLQTVFRVVPIEKTSAPASQAHSSAQAYSASAASGGNASGNTGERKKSKDHSSVGHKSSRCGSCDGCRMPNCGICTACQIRVGNKPRCERRICLVQQYQQQQQLQPAPTVAVVAPPTPTQRHKKKEKPTHHKERSRKRKRSLSPELFINPDLEGLRQCYGPSCRKNARSQSKYCSDECGITLATNRIFQVSLKKWKVFMYKKKHTRFLSIFLMQL